VPNRICEERSLFKEDLCKAILSSNIPLHKLKNILFSNFLTKYSNKNIPDESAVRKNYVSNIYQKKIENIRKYVSNKNIWIDLNETTDVESQDEKIYCYLFLMLHHTWSRPKKRCQLYTKNCFIYLSYSCITQSLRRNSKNLTKSSH